MKKRIKVRGEFPWNFKDFFLTNLLLKEREIIRVEKNPEITIGLVEPTLLTPEFRKSPKKILVAGENLRYMVNFFRLLEYITKKSKIKLNILNKILPRSILNIKLGPMRWPYYNYVKKIAQDTPEGEYSIICNDIRGKNILNLPYFLQVKGIVDNLGKLREKRTINLKQKEKFCCIIFSHESAFDRIDFFKKLSKYKKVDCFGNTSLTNSDNKLLPKCWTDNPKFLSQYKFVISFENSFENEYITEKLPNVILAGSIPIYKGAPNVSEYFNTDSFINFDNYGKNYNQMIEKIIELDNDDEKYKDFLKTPWMTERNKKKINDKQKELKKFIEKILK